MRSAVISAAAALLVSWAVAADVGAASSPTVLAPTHSAISLAALDRKVADLDSSEQADRGEIEQLGAHIAAEHTRVIERAKGLYKLTRAGLLPVGGGFEALVTHAMRVERVRHLLTAEVADETRSRARAVELAAELERIARDRAAFVSQRDAAEAERSASQDEAHREVAFDRAFQTSTGASADYVAVYGGTGGVASESTGGGFATARGKLVFPVAGRAEVLAARRAGTDGPGVEIHAPAGAVVRAAFAGRVAFADRYGPYGRIVILDHGSHYYTVSANLNEIDAKIGQDVAAGERIGTVGDEGPGPMLYFEVRHGSQTVPPGPWLGL